MLLVMDSCNSIDFNILNSILQLVFDRLLSWNKEDRDMSTLLYFILKAYKILFYNYLNDIFIYLIFFLSL